MENLLKTTKSKNLLLKFISLTKNRREKERKTMTKLLCCLIMRRESWPFENSWTRAPSQKSFQRLHNFEKSVTHFLYLIPPQRGGNYPSLLLRKITEQRTLSMSNEDMPGHLSFKDGSFMLLSDHKRYNRWLSMVRRRLFPFRSTLLEWYRYQSVQRLFLEFYHSVCERV